MLFALLMGMGIPLPVGAQTDSLYMSIEGTTIVSSKNTSVIRRSSAGMMSVDTRLMQNLPQILGNMDPIRFVRLLPGVQTNSECDSGIHIQGCDNAHNSVSSGGIPIYGINHLLGLFSVFNPAHYSKMNFSTSSQTGRLGGSIDMSLTDTLDKKFSADLSLGIMSSQGSIGLRLGKKSHLRASARASYLNLLYDRWLKFEQSMMNYSFSDYNFTYLYTPTGKDKLWADFYYGQDYAALDEMSYNIDLSVGWNNLLGALHWHHSGSEIQHKHSFFYSGYQSKINVLQDESKVYLPSYIMSGGYKGGFDWRGFSALAEVTAYHLLLQYPHIEGFLSFKDDKKGELQDALENSLKLQYRHTLIDRLDLSASLTGSFYISPESNPYYGLCPEISIAYDMYTSGLLKASYGWKNQYLFQTGLSNIGFPLEFWLMSGKYGGPQKSQFVDLSYEVDLLNGMVSASAGAYWKRLYNQLEYKGDIMDLLLSEYNLEKKLLKGHGVNYGLTFMIHKLSGDFTGWINYSVGRSVRQFDNPEYTGLFPSNHERIHDLHMAGTYKAGLWDFSGTFVFASGLPFTSPKSFHMSSGQLMVNYGRHNGSRLRPYIRLDVSATYHFNKSRNNGLNLSVYNVLARKNEMLYRLFVGEEGYHFGPVSMPLSLMPSISYFHKF